MIEKDEGDGSLANAGAENGGEAGRILPGHPPPDARNSNPQKEGYFRKPENWVSLGTLVAVMIYTGITGLMWCTSNRQLVAVIEANRINQDSYQSTQRAFITTSKVEFIPRGENGQITGWMFHVVVKNSGNTPTVHFQSAPNAVSSPLTPDDPEIRYERIATQSAQIPLEQRRRMVRAVIGPRDEIIHGEIGMPLHLLQADIANRISLHLTAAIHYEDIFHKKHVTKYCYVIGLNTEPDGILKPSYGMCGHWNCADDECIDDRKEYDAEMAARTPPTQQSPPPAEKPNE
jgi:hypothetical protein